MLKKYKPNGEIEFRPVYFNSITKTMINHKSSLGNAFHEIFYRTDELITGLMKDLARLLHSLSLSILIFQLIDHYQEVPTESYLLN